jgi:predicted ATP-binding protein involved in virulence
MQKIKIHMENCFGIKKMDFDFDFEDSNVYSIYAPNGVMKSSFAKTFHVLQLD